jgi:hypothetical protein
VMFLEHRKAEQKGEQSSKSAWIATHERRGEAPDLGLESRYIRRRLASS